MLRLALVSLFSLFLFSCETGDYPENLPPLEVEKTFPPNDAVVDTDLERIYVKFSSPVDKAYAYGLVVVSGANYIHGRSFLEEDGYVIAFYPFEDLPEGKRIVVRVNKKTKGVDTAPLGEEYRFRFYTENR